MDTEFSLSFGSGDEALNASAAAAAFDLVDCIEGLLTRFSDTSDVAVIGALKPGETAPVAQETMDVLVRSAEVAAVTCGAFDPVVGAVTPIFKSLDISRSSQDAADFSRCGFNRLILDTENHLVSVRPDSLGRATPVELDFGGIGKGFALDEIRSLLVGEQFECRDFLLDAGTSTIWAEGCNRAGEPWPLGIGGRWKSRTKHECVLRLSGCALSGSGFELQGAHVLDVRKRRVAGLWAASWVKCSCAAHADALSTAALALSPSELRIVARAMDAEIFVARHQKPFMDRFRDPLFKC